MSREEKNLITFCTANHPGARGLESHAVDLSAGWLEALVRILRRDTRSAAVGGDWRIVHGEEILERSGKIDMGMKERYSLRASPSHLSH